MKYRALNETIAEAVAVIEKKAIRAALRRHKGTNGGGPDITAMAAELGIARVTLWRKMKAHGLRTRIMVNVKEGETP